MANVNIAQLRTILQNAPTGQVVLIHASVLLSILTQYKASAGSDVVATTATGYTSRAPLDLTAY